MTQPGTISHLIRTVAFVLALSLVASLAIADSTSSAIDADAALAPDEQLLGNVVFVGASATDGWNVQVRAKDEEISVTRPVKLHDVFAASMKAHTTQVSSFSDFTFYTRPTVIGPRQIDKAIAQEPTLLVGVDYLFWFSYGNVGPDGKRLRQEADRLELLELGLAQLDRLECPIIVGDIPDMSAAVGLMLGASQMPDLEILKQLNERVRAWAKTKSNVTLYPLARLVKSMAQREAFSIGPHMWSAEMAGETIQVDQLHPTVMGLVALNQQVIQTLGSIHGIPMAEAFVDEAAAMRAKVDELLLEQAKARRRKAG